jgi:membrane associated rhomboid family serine protease
VGQALLPCPTTRLWFNPFPTFMDQVIASAAGFLRRAFVASPWAFLAWPAAAMVVGTLLRGLLGKQSQGLAVVPRTAGGLVGIATAPFIHASLSHLLANLPPFLVLGALVVLRKGGPRFFETAAVVALGSGLLVWVLARRGAHMGASGVIFGLFGYLLALAYFARATFDLVVAGVVLVFYGGMLVGLRPVRRQVSWEAHLFGLLVGIAKVWWLGR